MGKTSLANTFAEFLKSPTGRPMPVLTKGTDLEFTKVMQLYPGLSIDQNKDLSDRTSVQVEDLTPTVKLVTLKMAHAENQEDGASSSSLSSPAAIERASSKQGKPIRVPGETSDDETSDSETSDDEKSDDETNSGKDSKATGLQLKLVDMGGHSATMLLTAALTKP